MIIDIVEIFKSIQGEGVYQGKTQVFVRLATCNLQCSYCDTRIESHAQTTVDDALSAVDSLGECHSVAITGGEPLMQPTAVVALAQGLKERGYMVFLETNGTLPHALAACVENIDIISMDMKLPSSGNTEPYWAQHEEFLRIASTADVYVKIVVAHTTSDEDMLHACDIISRVRSATVLILQPEHSCADELWPRLKTLRRLCRDQGLDVEIREQLHKKLGMR
jgi:7-carboxy-7-deazaguanine synthase